MNSTDDCSAFFTRNTDLSGIGVRSAFYILVTLLPLQIVFAPGEYVINCWTLTTMNIGLLIATMVEIKKKEMSFFDAVIVVNLLSLAINSQLAIFMQILQSVQRWRKSLTILPMLFIVKTFLVSIFAVYLWANATHFGLQPECLPELRFYFFYIRVHFPFKTIRGLALTFYILWMLGCGIRVLDALLNSAEHPRLTPAELNSLSAPESVRDRLRGRGWSFVWLLENGLVEIPTLELFLRQNPQPDDSQGEWSFGQILALIGVVPALVSVVMAISSANRGEIEDVFAPVSTEED